MAPTTTSALLFSYGRVPAMNHGGVWMLVGATVVGMVALQLARLVEDALRGGSSPDGLTPRRATRRTRR
jgi:hypothetical protein